MTDGGGIEAYLRTLQEAGTADGSIARIRTRLQESTEYFDGMGITAPTAEDLAGWKTYLMATHPGHTKGSMMSDKTASDWVRIARNYYDWQKGQHNAMIQAEETAHEENGQVQPSDIRALTISECMNDEDEHHEGADTPDAPEATLGHSDIATSPKPKRGRRADPAKADRVAVSVYLPRETYAGIKDMADYQEKGVSDLLAEMASFTVKKNADVISRAREALARIREIKQQELRFEL